jgi:predicted Zn-dependent protease
VRHPATYPDGRTAERHEVSVLAHRTALHLHRSDGALLEAWPYAGLYAAEEVYGQGPVRLRHRQRGEATLTLPGADLLREVEALGGPRLRPRPWLRPSLSAALIALAVTGLLVAAAAWWLPALVAPLARQVPPDWEQALGGRALHYVAAERSFCTRAVGQLALARLAGRLAEQARLPYPLQVHVLPDDADNAFALPGGRILVLRGLLREARSPEELAGVLAHEIAHVARRDPLQALIRAGGAQLLFATLSGGGSALDDAAARFARMLVLFSYSRQDELAADRTAVDLLNRADIRGQPLAEFLARVADGPPGAGQVPALLSTHPVTAERIALVRAGAQGQGPALSEAQWRALRRICD